MVEKFGLNSDLAVRIFESYSENIKEYYGKNFVAEYYDIFIEKEVMSYIEQIGYENLVNATIAFNNSPIKYEDTKKKIANNKKL